MCSRSVYRCDGYISSVLHCIAQTTRKSQFARQKCAKMNGDHACTAPHCFEFEPSSFFLVEGNTTEIFSAHRHTRYCRILPVAERKRTMTVHCHYKTQDFMKSDSWTENVISTFETQYLLITTETCLFFVSHLEVNFVRVQF